MANISIERARLLSRIESIVLGNQKGSFIFGGYVRDLVLRHNAGQTFLTTHSLDDYHNDSIEPESFSDRNLFPRDLDLFVPTPDVMDLIVTQLRDVDGLNVVDPKQYRKYFRTSFDEVFCVYELAVTYAGIGSNGIDLQFKIDVLVPRAQFRHQRLAMSALGMDMECNLLYTASPSSLTSEFLLEPRNVHVRPVVLTPVADVISRVVRRETTILHQSRDVVNKTSIHRLLVRVVHRMSSGWKIVNAPFLAHRFTLCENCSPGQDLGEMNSMVSDCSDSSCASHFCCGESACCISGEEFLAGELVYKFKGSSFIMSETSLARYMTMSKKKNKLDFIDITEEGDEMR
jgi:hypothetical protein